MLQNESVMQNEGGRHLSPFSVNADVSIMEPATSKLIL